MKKTTCFLVVVFMIAVGISNVAMSQNSAQSVSAVTNTSFTNSAGEKILRLEILLPVSVEKAWDLFTKDDNLKKWMAPLAHIDLKTGGTIVTNYNTAKSLADSSSIRLPIIHFLEKELLTLKVNLNSTFPESVRKNDSNLQEIIQLKPEGADKTKIISFMLGFGSGAEWEKVYNFFLKGNSWTFEQLAKNYR